MKRLRIALALMPVGIVALLALPLGGAHAQARIVTVATFAVPQLPEGLAIDAQGNVYLSMATTGEIRRLAPNGTASTLATLRNGMGFLLGLAVDAAGNVYAALPSGNSPDSDTNGVWRIRPDGAKELLGAMPADTVPNGLAFDRQGNLFVSDSAQGTIWRMTPARQVSLWLDHPLLKGDPNVCPPNELPFVVGANGLAIDRSGALYAANTLNALVARIPVNANGSAGTPAVYAGPDCATLKGADGIAFDAAGNLYVAANVRESVVRITPARRVEALATKADGLDFPASVAFGAGRSGQNDLYLTNFAVLAALGGGAPRPSLMRISGAAAGPSGLPRTGNPGDRTAPLPLSPLALLALGGGALLALGVGLGPPARRRLREVRVWRRA